MKTHNFIFFTFLATTFIASAHANSLEDEIYSLTQKIDSSPDNIKLLMQRAKLLFENNQHQQAVDVYSLVIKYTPKNHHAFFGRGMALGRLGEVQKGIDDISVFIQHNPKSSLAFTKRGVRYLWLGNLKKAANDFKKAIAINPKNAEAHDDLGVIMAQQGRPKEAIDHFLKTIKYDPSYQKAYHNLSLTYFIYDNNQAALIFVNKALALSPESKDTVLLKSEILKSLGQLSKAEQLREDAMFLPDGNWSESMPIQQQE
jgi:tetratricopeptide (TPR) repeat protein